MIIPKRGFESSQDLSELRALVKEHVPRTSVAKTRSRWRAARIASMLAVIIAVLVVFVWNGRPRNQSFAGYVWCCDANSVTATWTVPAVRNPPPGGLGALWIGVQSSLAGGTDPFFLQVGITFGNYYSVPQYGLFWSDAAVRFLPQPLGTANPGDQVRFSLTHRGSRWVAAYDDITQGLSGSTAVTLRASAADDLAEWIEEDPRTVGTVLPSGVVPMARVQTTMTGLEVDGAPPASGQMVAQRFVDDTGTVYYPTAYADDSFRLLHRGG